MTTIVRFWLSFGPLKWDFITFKMIIISKRNASLTRTLSMTLRLRAKVLLHMRSNDFYNMSLSIEFQRRRATKILIYTLIYRNLDTLVKLIIFIN